MSVFISHSSCDDDFIARLAQDLERRNITTWVDEARLEPGDNFISKIEEGLQSATAVLLVLSPYSVISNWVKEERNAAQLKAVESSTRLIPLLIGDITNDEIPLLQRTRIYVDFRDDRAYEAGLKQLVSALKPEKPDDSETSGSPFSQSSRDAGPFLRPRLSWIRVNPSSLERIATIVKFLLRIYLVGFIAYIGLKLLTYIITEMDLGQVWSSFLDPYFLQSFIVALFGYALYKFMEAGFLNWQIVLSLLLGLVLLALAFLSCALIFLATEWQPAHIAVIAIVSIVFLIMFVNYSNVFFYLRKRSYGDAALEIIVAVIFLVMYTLVVLGPVERFMHE